MLGAVILTLIAALMVLGGVFTRFGVNARRCAEREVEDHIGSNYPGWRE